jgi:hypothetical protein
MIRRSRFTEVVNLKDFPYFSRIRSFLRRRSRRSALPPLAEIAPRCGPLLPPNSTLIRRHVETIRFHDETHATRHLTIDIVLPRSRTRAIARVGDDERFYLPLALMAKVPPTTGVDLRAEDGTALPLLNRSQNALLTHGALVEWAEGVLGGELTQELQGALSEMVLRDGVGAAFAREYAYLLIDAQFPGLLDDPVTSTLQELVDDFSVNSLLWVGLTGRPGARRVIKLSYDITTPVPPIPRRRARRKLEEVVLEDGASVYVEYLVPGDGHAGSTPRRIGNRIASTIGWAPIDLNVKSPYVRGCASYHMQVITPPGLEPRAMNLAGPLLDEQRQPLLDSKGAPVRPDVDTHGRVAHLYFAGARSDREAFINLRLRAPRRGFLSLSFLFTAVISGLLWAFQGSAAEASRHPEVAAATLLITPPLLGLFVVRTDEHGLLSRVLGGVRLLVLATGLFSIAAASALIDVRPAGWTLHESWRNYAIGASTVASVLAVSLFLSLRVTWMAADRLASLWRTRLIYFLSALVVLGTGAVALNVAAAYSSVAEVDGLAIPVLAVTAISALALAVQGRAVAPAEGAGLIPWLAAIGAAVTAVGAATAAGVDFLQLDWDATWHQLALVQNLLLLILCVTESAHELQEEPQPA